MRALVIEEPFRAVVKEVPVPIPGADELVIKVSHVGICGTDFHIYEGEFLAPYPIIPGHEFSGTVHRLGPGVDGFAVGDRVTADPSLFCGACNACLTSKGNHCANWGALGNTVNGSMAEYVVVPARNVLKMPDEMSFETGAFIEPMACVVHAMNRLQMKSGSSVLLFGAGAMGLQLTQALARSGASRLVAVDVSDYKLQLAKQWGATETVRSHELHQLEKRQFDVVVDATGIPSVIQTAFDFMGPAATYLQFGVTPPHAEIRLNSFDLYRNDWTILGSMAINHTFIPAFHWVQAGRISLEPLISSVITLEEAAQFLAQPRDPDLLKVQIKL